MLVKDLMVYYPVVEVFASRKLKASERIRFATRLLRLKEAYERVMKERSDLVLAHAVKNENGDPVFTDEAQTQVKLEDPKATGEELNEFLNSEVDVAVKPMVKILAEADEATGIEIAALIKLGLLEPEGD